MKIQQQRDLNNHYLVLHDQETEVLNSYQTKMLNENEITGMLSCHVEHIDDEVMFFYNVTSRQSLSEITSDRMIGTGLLKTILEALLDALRGLGEYLLPPEGLLLSPDCIFADSMLKDIRFCYFPGREDDFSAGLKSFSEFLLPKLDHDDRDAVMLGYSFYQACVNDTLTGERFAQMLYSGPVSESGCAHELPDNFADCRTNEPREEEESDVSEEERRRQQILDDFFSDDDTEEADPEAGKKRVYYGITIALSAAVTIILVLAGFRDIGIGSGILMFAGAVLAGRWKDKISDKRDGTDDRKGKREAGAADSGQMEYEVSSNWQEPGCFYSREKQRESRREEETPLRMPDYLVRHYSVSETDSDEKTGNSGGVHRGGRFDEDIDAARAGDGETVLLSAVGKGDGRVRARLINLDDRTEPAHLLTKDEYRVGKSQIASDIVLNSEAVSRLHAKLIWEDDHYCLRDMRSKNATFINETMIDAGEDIALKDGDCCRFADLVYRYRTGA